MTLDDILHTAAGVMSVVAFGIGTLWGIHNNPADTAVALFSLILIIGVNYAMRDEWKKWHEEQLAKNRR